jgi:hypothetical protein
VRQEIEGRSEEAERIAGAQIYRSATVCAHVVEGLCDGKKTPELDGSRGPSRDVTGEHFEQRESSFSSTVIDCLGDLLAGEKRAVSKSPFRGRDVARLAGFRRRTIADQICDVWNHPFFAGFNEPVLIKLPDVSFNDVDLFGDDPQQAPKRLADFGVPLADVNGK